MREGDKAHSKQGRVAGNEGAFEMTNSIQIEPCNIQRNEQFRLALVWIIVRVGNGRFNTRVFLDDAVKELASLFCVPKRYLELTIDSGPKFRYDIYYARMHLRREKWLVSPCQNGWWILSPRGWSGIQEEVKRMIKRNQSKAQLLLEKNPTLTDAVTLKDERQLVVELNPFVLGCLQEEYKSSMLY